MLLCGRRHSPHLQKLTVLPLKMTWGRIEISKEGLSTEGKAPQHYNDIKPINTSKLNKTDKNIKISTTGSLGWKPQIIGRNFGFICRT